VKVEGELYAKKHPAALDAALWNVRRLYAGSGRYSVVELAVNARYDLHRLTQRLGHDALLEISDE
jgi:hypothetical protein